MGIAKPTDSSTAKDRSSSPTDVFKKDIDYHYTVQSPNKKIKKPSLNSPAAFNLKRVQSEKSDSSGSSYKGDFQHSEYSMLK